MTSELNTSLKSLLKLKQSKSQKLGTAPHKPVLILAIINEIEHGRVNHNLIEINASLLSSFKEVWNTLVKSQHTPNFSLPFFHLKNEKEGLWTLITKSGFEKAITSSNSIKSLSALKEFVMGAKLRGDVFSCLLDDVNRTIIKSSLLESYFGRKISTYKLNDNYIKKFEEDSLLKSNEYQSILKKHMEALSKDEYEEEVFIRSGAFKNNILRLYNDTCAVTGIRVIASSNISMVDACHIVPFSEGHDDTVTNGLALSPTIHRAFDRGLISIDQNYKVIVSPNFHESNTSHSLRQYHNKAVLLPSERLYIPSQENLQEHRISWGFS